MNNKHLQKNINLEMVSKDGESNNINMNNIMKND